MIVEEDWIEYIKRSTDEAMEKMENAKIRCWNKTHKRMKWRLALRITSFPSERWLVKAAEWKSEVSSKCRTNRAIWRPTRRWEDDEFLKLEESETEHFIESNKTWINTAKDRGRWTLLEENYTTNSEGRHENNTGTRRNSHNIPARYVNGVKLSDEELADIT